MGITRMKAYVSDSRTVSAFELLLGTAIVVGHNVLHAIPNEVPILVLLGLVSVRLRNGGSSAIGFKRPPSWARLVQIAPAAAALRIGLLWLLIVSGFAAFGEEIAYRGYLLTRAADLGRRSTTAYGVGVVLVSVLFGYGHYYKGPAGIVDSGVAGLILGSAYLLSGRNLWTSVLAHGFIDTFGVTVAYLGWDS